MLEQEGDGNVQNDMKDLLNGPSALPKAQRIENEI